MNRPHLCIEVIPESQITPMLNEEICQHLFDCFAWRQRAMDNTRTWYGQAPDCTIIGRIDGALVAHTAVVKRRYLTQSMCPGGLFPTDSHTINSALVGAGIQGVSVQQRYRRHKYGIEILTAAMEQAKLVPYRIAILHAPDYLDAFYGRLGWKWNTDIAYILDVNNKPAKTQPGNRCMTVDLI